MELKGSVAWLTGGISGIGGAVSKAFHERGAKLLLTDINEEKGQEFVKQFGDDAIFLKADVTVREELEAAAAKAVEKWGHLDILLNAAGRGFGLKFLTDDPEEIKQGIEQWDKGIKVNLYGSFHTAQVAANYMKKNEPNENGERGNIIFISSMAGDKVWYWFDERVADTVFSYDYGAAKAAILGLSRVILRPLLLLQQALPTKYGRRCNFSLKKVGHRRILPLWQWRLSPILLSTAVKCEWTPEWLAKKEKSP